MTASKKKVGKDWVVMIYLAGDNNLSEDMSETLAQLLSVKIDDVAILVYYDSAYPEIPTCYRDITPSATTKPLGFSTQDPCEYIGESDSADPESIVKFVTWCGKRYETDNYALFLSGHSDGFQGLTLFRDDDSRATMNISSLRESLDNVVKNVIGKRFQILGFDGCVMSTFEIAYEFRMVANIMIGSQGFIPDAGLNYEDILIRWSNIKIAPKTPEEFAKNVLEVFKQNQKGFELGGRSTTLSACRLGKVRLPDGKVTIPLENLEAEISKLSELLFDNLSTAEIFNPKPDAEAVSDEKIFETFIQRFIAREQLKRVLLSSQWNSQTLLFEQAIDIKDFCEQLSMECDETIAQLNLPTMREHLEDWLGGAWNDNNDSTSLYHDIREQCQHIIAEFDNCLIDINGGVSTGSDFRFANGLSLYFPWSEVGYGVSRVAYEKTLFAIINKDKSWSKFIKMYVSEVTLKGISDLFGKYLFRLLHHQPLEDAALVGGIDILGAFDKALQKVGRYNTEYDRRGLNDAAYANFFSKFKNLPRFQDDNNPLL